jgi:hypothetical protein
MATVEAGRGGTGVFALLRGISLMGGASFDCVSGNGGATLVAAATPVAKI